MVSLLKLFCGRLARSFNLLNFRNIPVAAGRRAAYLDLSLPPWELPSSRDPVKSFEDAGWTEMLFLAAVADSRRNSLDPPGPATMLGTTAFTRTGGSA